VISVIGLRSDVRSKKGIGAAVFVLLRLRDFVDEDFGLSGLTSFEALDLTGGYFLVGPFLEV
jgi:hypothetical protein